MPIYEIPADEYNKLLAEALKQIPELKMPEWANYVKTSVARARPPAEEDWWHKRTASILRQLYIHEIVGVGRLRTRYGGRKNRGMRPEEFRKGSGKIIRVILQQAEAAGFVEKTKTSKRTGRKLTEKGKKFLEKIKLNKKENKAQVQEVKTEIKEVKKEPEEKKEGPREVKENAGN